MYIYISIDTDYKVFENFQVIEQMHLDKVLRVIDKYDIYDPIGDSDVDWSIYGPGISGYV